jgi:hypothetical protein
MIDIIFLLIVGFGCTASFFFWEHYIQTKTTRPPLMRLQLWTRAKGKLATVYMIGCVSWMGFVVRLPLSLSQRRDSRLISVIFLSRYPFLSGGARPWPHSSDAAIHPLRSFGCTLQCTSRVASCQSLNSMDYLYRSPIHWVSRFFIHSHPPLHPN